MFIIIYYITYLLIKSELYISYCTGAAIQQSTTRLYIGRVMLIIEYRLGSIIDLQSTTAAAA